MNKETEAPLNNKNADRISLLIPPGINKIRADKVLAQLLQSVSRSHIQNAFAQKQVLLKGQAIAKNERISSGDEIHIALPELPSPTPRPVALPLDILFEDQELIVVNKQAGQVVHPGHGTQEDTLVHALLHHTSGQLSANGGEERPGVVHRLDKETSGLIVFAKTNEAYLHLIHLFATRQITKVYTAIVAQVPRLRSGKIDAAIGRHPNIRVKMAIQAQGRPARTEWELVEAFPRNAQLQLWPYTGRTHQIRVHLSHIGHPIVGDRTYGWRPRPNDSVPPRILLHAQKLSFMHPKTGHLLDMKASLPEDMRLFCQHLKEEPGP